MYRETQEPMFINIVNDNGGLGDAIARLPAIKYINDKHPHITPIFWVHDYLEEFIKHVFQGSRVIVKPFKDIKDILPYKARCFSIHKYSNLGSHLTDHAFHVIVNKDVDLIDKNYLKPNFDSINIDEFNLPTNYVVMSTGFTAPVREFLPNYINLVNEYILEKGYNLVFLGQKVTKTGVTHDIKGKFNEEIDYDLGINLIDRTDLLQASKIIQNATAIVGLDNGLLHLAGCTDTAIVGGFTSVEPKYRMPYRHNVLGWNYYPVVPKESLTCRFCQSNMTFTYDNDFKLCYYKDYECVKQLDANAYIKELEKIL